MKFLCGYVFVWYTCLFFCVRLKVKGHNPGCTLNHLKYFLSYRFPASIPGGLQPDKNIASQICNFKQSHGHFRKEVKKNRVKLILIMYFI